MKTGHQIQPNYDEYVKEQTQRFLSWENEHKTWRDGQPRAIEWLFEGVPHEALVLDVGCGVGEGLAAFQKAGRPAVGVDLSGEKVDFARRRGLVAVVGDMMTMRDRLWERLRPGVIYSSHSLEHAQYPMETIAEWYWLLPKNTGLACVVLPYIDQNPVNEVAHLGKYELGLDVDDDGKTVVKTFEDRGFTLVKKCRDSFREPEIWLVFRKV